MKGGYTEKCDVWSPRAQEAAAACVIRPSDPSRMFGLQGGSENLEALRSLGVIAYILICGVPPFGGKNDAAILEKVKAGVLVFKTKVSYSRLHMSSSSIHSTSMLPS